MSNPIENRYDFALFFDVENGNPNGDPDAGNMPRTDVETGLGLVTDVCIKRKVRNYIELIKGDEAPYRIYIQNRETLNSLDEQALTANGIQTSGGAKDATKKAVAAAKKNDDKLDKKVAAYMCDNFFDVRTFGAVMTTFTAAGLNCGQIRGPAAKKNDDKLDKKVAAYMCDNFFDVRTFGAVMTTFTAAGLNCGQIRGPIQMGFAHKLDKKVAAYMCDNFFDVRTFGAVMTTFTAAGLNCGQIRGPIQMGFAQSIDPIMPTEITITREAVTTADDATTKNNTMGSKWIVPYGLYRMDGYVSAALAQKLTGFSDDDLQQPTMPPPRTTPWAVNGSCPTACTAWTAMYQPHWLKS